MQKVSGNIYVFILLAIFLISCKNNGTGSNTNADTSANEGKERAKMMIQYSDQNVPRYYFVYEYNDDGFVKTEQIIDSTVYPVKVSTKIYYYEDSLLTKMDFIDDLGNTTYIVEYEYDDEGNMLKQTSRDAEIFNIVEYKYDERGNAVEQVTRDFSQGPEYVTKMQFAYDEEDNIIEGKSYDYQGNMNRWNKNIYVDDTMRAVIFLSPQGDTTHHIVYEYNNKGQLISEKEIGNDGNTYIIKSHGWDDDGNKVIEESNRYQFYKLIYYRNKETGRLEQERMFDLNGNLQRMIIYE